MSNTDWGVGGVGPGVDTDDFGVSFNFVLSGDDPASRSISLKAVPDPAAFPKALALPLNALKALLDTTELPAVVVVLAPSVGVVGEPNAGWPNADTGFAAEPMALGWPNTEPGVAGTGTFGADGCPPPNALMV